jgi:hypothetical protein
MEQADAAALDIIATDVLDPEVIARTLDKLMARFDATPEDAETRREKLTATQQKLERELANIQSAVAAGTASETCSPGSEIESGSTRRRRRTWPRSTRPRRS